MTSALSIVEVARETGISARTLRYYETRGLLSAQRSASGRRLYDAEAIARIHQILVLKRAGLTLEQVGAVLAGRAPDLPRLLAGQRAALAQQRAAIERMEARLDEALRHLEAGAPLDAHALCALIRQSERCAEGFADFKPVVDRYWSPHAQEEWRRVMQPVWDAHPEWADGGYEALWSDLSARIEAALPLDPLSDTALAFSREWNALIEPITRVATPAMRASTAAMFENRPQWEGTAETGFSHAVWTYMREAQVAQRRAGKDIGLSPFPMPGTQHDRGKVNP